MDVARAPDPGVIRLRHERDRAPVQVRDLLRAVLVDDVVVGHRQRVVVAEVDLLLARPRLALRALDAHARRVHPVSDLPHQRLAIGRREDVVVEDVRDRRRQVAVVLVVRLLVGLLQQIELELRADHRLEPARLRALDLRAQHLTRRGDAPATRRPRRRRTGPAPCPRATASAAASPGREPARSRRTRAPRTPSRTPARVHLHVEREQVVAALGAVPVLDLLEEVIALLPLPDQPALHVGERHDDRVDRGIGAELVKRQHRRSLLGAGTKLTLRGRRPKTKIFLQTLTISTRPA